MNISLANRYIDHNSHHLDIDEVVNMVTKLAVCLTDHTGKFMDVNEAYLALYGFDREELIGHHFTKVLSEEYHQYATQLHDDFIAGSIEMPADWEVQNKQNQKIKIHAIAVRVESNDGDKPPTKMTLIERI